MALHLAANVNLNQAIWVGHVLLFGVCANVKCLVEEHNLRFAPRSVRDATGWLASLFKILGSVTHRYCAN
jgi:hypothetical protein